MILAFLVTFFAIYYHQSYRGDALQSISEKSPRTSTDATDSSSVEEIDMEPNDEPANDESSKQKSGKIVTNQDKNIGENEVKFTEDPLAPIWDLIDEIRREEEIDSRTSNPRAVLTADEEVPAKGKSSDESDCNPSDDELRNQFREMMPFIEVLNLTNKTQEEIRKELYVDFSTLDTHTMPEDERMRAKVLLNLYANTLRPNNIREPAEKRHPSDRSKYNLEKFNNGIVALGVENFMKAATQFCEEEAAAGEIPIVSIGSGDGTIEKEIIAQYRESFGKEIRIQLVDPDPKFVGIVDFKTVDHLIAENPRIVGNCVAFIIWPNLAGDLTEEEANDDYDIEAIRQLQPKAVLTVYESTGGSGSNDFRAFLHEDSLDEIPPEEFGIHNWLSKFQLRKKESYGLDNYAVIEMARERIFLPQIGTSIARMVKIVRKS